MKYRRARRYCQCLMLGCCLLGCAEDNRLNRQAISGTVLLDGEPLALGTIRFTPHEQRGVASGGPIEAGQYAIRAAEGLPAGKYLVRIYATKEDDRTVDEGAPPGPPQQKPGIDLIPARYNAKSDLVREVINGSNQFDFKLTSE